ncbi:2-polyprenyl-3-methyl-6-methoxy-1,4-benzoquinone monooxygenase [Marinagarivorans algicola]|uniref:2-polyprenyl-3-methyl-6-methoxy-1,4-benzoquinone monooxygenase n=1 Tax=Marinagarivorans algicola TaxID=1513270 RepID=UPI0006B42C7F|nr:2-polyprenyl-3-methyl-6-methoxy-1,4-benzoquinone monooxygenase [Marinagarivorans algicola]
MPSPLIRHLSFIDKSIHQLDTVIRTLHAKQDRSTRASPADTVSETELTPAQKKHSAGLIRVNHSGEVCAQALYQGQALTAKRPKVKKQMAKAASEEEDHLAWCQQRLNELNAQPSRLNLLWYGASLGIGISAGLISDKLSLGFVAATEDQVCQHLRHHMQSLPTDDVKSHAIVKQMHIDEAEHGATALSAGGYRFPRPVKRAMSQIASIMTWLSYRI